MASYYVDTGRFASGIKQGFGPSRTPCCLVAIVAMTTAMIDNTNDNVTIGYLPMGAVVTAVKAYATDMDTNGSPTLAFDIGDSGDQDRLLAASNIGQAGTGNYTGLVASTGFMHKYTADTAIVVAIQAVAATGAAGTLKVVIEYFVDQDFSTTAQTASTTA